MAEAREIEPFVCCGYESGSPWTNVPKKMMDEHLKRVQMEYYMLRELPNELLEHPEIENIVFDHCTFIGNEALQSLVEFKSLGHLRVSACGLQKVPGVISKLVSLRHLDLGGNCINTLPRSLITLKDLKVLSVANTAVPGSRHRGLSDYQEFISNLTTLQELKLSGNKNIKIFTCIHSTTDKFNKT